MVMYNTNWHGLWLFVSETGFDRNMSWIARGEKNIRTISFPNTVREVEYNTFAGNQSLRSAVLNEGLEVLGTNGYIGSNRPLYGVFEESAL